MALVTMVVEKDGEEYVVSAIIDGVYGPNNRSVPVDQYDYILSESYIEVAGVEDKTLPWEDVAEYYADIIADILAKHPDVAERVAKLLARRRPEALEKLCRGEK